MDLLTRIRSEIELRLRELRPVIDEYERLLSAAGDLPQETGSAQPSSPNGAGPAKRERAPRGAAQHAILAALEHGSHTVGELAVVTAMSGSSTRQNLRRLVATGMVTRAKREGKTAYALASPRR